MAKQANVLYQLPIEEMHGRLATKQQNITYSGQRNGEDTLKLGDGKHTATNYEQYVVLTRRRGKNLFYVKSRTTVSNSIGTTFARALLALTTPLVDWYLSSPKSTAELLQYNQFVASYEFFGQQKTIREYLASRIMECVKAKQEYITFYTVPDAQGISQVENLIKNPFRDINSEPPILGTTGATTTFGKKGNDSGLIQAYLPYFARLQNATAHTINVIRVATGQKYSLTFNVAATTTMDDIDASTQYQAAELSDADGEIESVTLYNRKGLVLLKGKPYTDETLTTAVGVGTAINTFTTWYI